MLIPPKASGGGRIDGIDRRNPSGAKRSDCARRLSLSPGGGRACGRAVDVATAGPSTEPPAGDAGPIRALPAWLATSRAGSRENFPSELLTIGRIHQSINQVASWLSAS